MKISAIFFFLLIIMSSVNAASYYVDNNIGNDNNSGLIPESPFKTIAKLSTKALNAGDNVFFARGSVWKELFSVNYSGTSSAPITIDAYGTGALPQIDAELIRQNGIYIYGKSNIKVKNINVINQAGPGGIRIKYSSSIVVDSCVIYATHQGGVFIENSTNSFICRNIITTPATSYNTQTDGIYSQRNRNITFDGNCITISNLHVDQHCDGIQSYLDTSLTFCNNKIKQDNPKTYNAQGIYTTTGAGNFIVFNNVVDCGLSTSNTLAVDNITTGTASAEVYNNTLINKGFNCMMVNVLSLNAKNNIFRTMTNGAAINIASVVTPSDLDRNMFYNGAGSGSNMIYYRGAYKTLSQWQAMGCDLNSTYNNPTLNSDCSIPQTSPAVDAGIELGSVYNVDVNGTSRPQLNGIDLGAFEYKSGGIVIPDTIMPVELVSFTGTVQSNKVILQWRTATETNNLGFDVEKNKGTGWVKIGFVQGAGNSNSYKDYSYTDKYFGKKVSYRLKQIDFDGQYQYSNIVEIAGSTKRTYSISQNFPNPFNPSTKLSYYIPFTSRVTIAVYNVTGEQVASLVNSNIETGTYEVNWNASDLASGIYFLRIYAEGLNGEEKFSDIRKLNLVK